MPADSPARRARAATTAARNRAKAQRDHDALIRARATATALAGVLERPRAIQGVPTFKAKQLSVGANAGTWVCDGLETQQRDGEADGDWIKRTMSLLRMVKAGIDSLNHFPEDPGE